MSTNMQDLLTSYILGDLDAAQNAAIEERLNHEPDLQRELERLEETFCAMAQALTPITPSPAARQRLLDALEPTARFEPYIQTLTQMLDLAWDTVRDLLATLDDPSTVWEDGPGSGVKIIHLPSGPRFEGALAGFVRMEPGLQFPHHKHVGRERVLVIQGGLRDSEGRVCYPGDEIVMEDDTEHHFTSLHDAAPLIYVVTLGEGVEFPNH